MKYSKKSEPNQNSGSGFTLAELLVSMTVLSVLLLMLTQLLSQVQQTWTYSQARISQFREARVAFDIISKNLSQATLNTYLDFVRNPRNNQVTGYQRQSELHFVTGPANSLGMSTADHPTHAIFFQAPLGRSDRFKNLGNLFNARGYYIEYGNDDLSKPSFIQATPKYRYRLMEYLPPAEENQVFIDGNAERDNGKPPIYDNWYKYQLSNFSHPLAENVVALILSPREAIANPTNPSLAYSQLAPNYAYDSNTAAPIYAQQVPPLVKVTLVAIDETSALRLSDASGSETSAPDVGLGGLFKSAKNYDTDITTLKNYLNGEKINYKIFSTTVAIRSSKWSTAIPLGSGGGGGGGGGTP